MNILIVYAHPSEQSFTSQVLAQLRKGLEGANHQVTIVDLYEIGFQTDMSPDEYMREGFANTSFSISLDVQEQHKLLDQADAVIFLYPVWWSDCPAKLKGWFDRVYSAGYAYSKTEEPRGMKTISKGLVICTAGHSNQVLEESGIAESMRKVMLQDRLADRFAQKEMVILGGTLEGEEVKQKWLEEAYRIGRGF